MATHNWAHIRLSVFVHQSRSTGRIDRVDYRLMAKPPGDEWTQRHTVALGNERVDGLPWPPSRDDMLALMTEVLMGLRWTAEGEEPPF